MWCGFESFSALTDRRNAFWGEVVSLRCFSHRRTDTNPHDGAVKSAVNEIVLLFVMLNSTHADWNWTGPNGKMADSLSVYAKGCQVTEGEHEAGNGDGRGSRPSGSSVMSHAVCCLSAWVVAVRWWLVYGILRDRKMRGPISEIKLMIKNVSKGHRRDSLTIRNELVIDKPPRWQMSLLRSRLFRQF